MTSVYCNQCGHRNPPDSAFCSACGAALEPLDEHTISLARVDPLQDAIGDDDNPTVSLGEIPESTAVLIVRSGSQAGQRFLLKNEVTRLGRHPDSEISLDDITVSRRHAEIVRVGDRYVVHDVGSLNGTYVNQQRVDEAPLHHGDELQVGKFRLLYFEAPRTP